ncbi:MAG: bifunctional 5,10-methylenetetrahydrofolate dehydrogenase/5,10-methenyltetrahydrofolate cyclohydrolase [Elusimicrobiota bacterium]|nr:bifunctional 5,10-methylenetetrahydrofolate dehydrogenase/5,10-methenyltetrahydrofolate cyclohydrolase [Elusimicrobiota bacterium]
MSAKTLDGRALAARVLAQARRDAAAARLRLGRRPRLAVVAAAGADAESYLKAKRRACEAAGVELVVHRLSPGPRHKTLGLLAELAGDASVDAVLVETPLPRGLSPADVAAVLPEAKDAEGVTPGRYGRLFLTKTWKEAESLVAPCTASALARLAAASGVPLAGKRAVVVGRSATVGRPAAHLLSTLDMTVTLAHSRTRGLAALCREADLLVAAAGVPGLIKPSWVKRGAVLLDAGIHLVRGRLVGDAAPGCAARARRATPVPGGVGPVTTAVLVLQAARLASSR